MTTPSGAFYRQLTPDPKWREQAADFDRQHVEHYQRMARSLRRELDPHVSLERAHILDAGCGRGVYGRLLAGPKGRAVGLDVHLTDLLLARDAAPAHCVYALGDLARLPLAENCMDLVLCRHTLEHLPRPMDFMREAFRVLRPGGWLYCSTPNAFSPALVASVDGRKWLRRILLGRDEGVYHLLTHVGLCRMARRAGFGAPVPVAVGAWSATGVTGLLRHIRFSIKVLFPVP